MILVIKKIDEDKLREFKAEAVRRGLTYSKAIEEAIDLWLSQRSNIRTESQMNNLTYRKLKDKLIKKYFGKYVVIANGELIGVYNNIDEVSNKLKTLNVKHAIVAKIGEEPIKGELTWLGGSMRLRTA